MLLLRLRLPLRLAGCLSATMQQLHAAERCLWPGCEPALLTTHDKGASAGPPMGGSRQHEQHRNSQSSRECAQNMCVARQAQQDCLVCSTIDMHY